MSFVIVNVNYGGYWADCVYQGGREIDIVLSTDSISVYNLRYQIANMCSFLGTDFDISYLKTTRSGRLVKSPLGTDEALVRLCRTEASPKVYICSNNTASSSQFPGEQAGPSSPYFPTFEQPSQFGGPFDFGYQGSDWRTNLEQIGTGATFSNWTDEVYHGDLNFGTSSFPHVSTPRENLIPDLNFTPEDEHNGRTEARARVDTYEVIDDDDDPDYDVEADAESTESDRPGDNSERRLNRSLFAEYTAWIQSEGGMEKLLRLMYPSPHDDEDEEDLDTGHMSNWIVPMVPIQPESSVVYAGDVNLIVEGLAVNAMYDTKDELTIAVGLWNLEKNAESKVERSDTGRLYLKCKSSKQCPFKLHATASGGGHFLVSKFCGDHTCNQEIVGVKKRKLRSTVIGAFFAKRILRDQEIIKPKVIQNELKEVYGVDIKYDVALRGRNRAIQMIYGQYEDSFKMLPGYLAMLKRTNPGTVTQIEIGDDGRFKQVFIALGATRVSYSSCMRPVIIVDGTHLKGKNNGILFVAVAKDANEQLYPLAYGIGPIENHACWTFFMRGLRRTFGALEDTLIVSDQHISIIHAVSIVFPDAHHGLCYFHLSKNLAHYGKHVIALFQRAAYTYDVNEWNDRMNQIRDLNANAHAKLMDIGPAKWARSMCPPRRFSNMTSNAAESFNNTLLWARRLPICACLDAVRLVIEQWFDERRLDSQSDNHPISSEARQIMADLIEHARRYRITQTSQSQFNVRTSQKTLTVNLQEQKCECLRWQRDCLPCAHAIAAIMHIGGEVSHYISSYYQQTTYARSYELSIFRVPHKSTWPQELQSTEVLPSIRVRLPGRPRERRRRGRGEARRRASRGSRKCPHCDQTGHVANMCHLWLE